MKRKPLMPHVAYCDVCGHSHDTDLGRLAEGRERCSNLIEAISRDEWRRRIAAKQAKGEAVRFTATGQWLSSTRTEASA